MRVESNAIVLPSGDQTGYRIAVGRTIDLAHAAGADLFSDFVDAETRARSQGQTAGSIAVSVARTRLIMGDGVVFVDAVSGVVRSNPLN